METFSESSDIGMLMRDVATEFQHKAPTAPNSSSGGDESTPMTRVISVAAEMLLNCHVADAASTLSQGQKQLLCVARILLGKIFPFSFFTTIPSHHLQVILALFSSMRLLHLSIQPVSSSCTLPSITIFPHIRRCWL